MIKNSLKVNDLDFELFHIREITFEDEAPRREALGVIKSVIFQN